MRFRFFTITALSVLALLVSVPNGFGQSVTATLNGSVTDNSGAAVPGAAITLTNELSGDVRKTATSATGYYALPAIPVGSYKLSVESAGFKASETKGIVLNASDDRSVNVALQVGAVSETIEVSADASQIETVATGAKAVTLDSETLQNVAIVGRSAAEFLKIMPGMAGTNGTTNSPKFGGQVIGINGSGNAGAQSAVGGFAANGTPTASVEITSDGAHTSDPGCNCATPVNPNPEMLQEVHVLTTSFGAENAYGPTVITTTTKAGGNSFHGELYDSIRNYNLNSNDSQNNAKGSNAAGQPVAPKPAFVFNFPGANIGGPVLIPGTKFNKNHDKLFFFSGFEYFYQTLATSNITTVVPDAAMRAGNFSPAEIATLGSATNTGGGLKTISTAAGLAMAPGGIVPPSLFDKGGQAMLSLLPMPNANPNTTGGYNYVGQVPFNQNGWQMVHRLDYSISDSTKLFIRYYHQQELQVFPIAMWGGTGAPTGVPWPSTIHGANSSDSFAVNLTHVFSPTLTNEFVAAYTYVYFGNTMANPTAGLKSTVGYPYHGVFNNGDPYIPDLTVGSTLVALGQQGAFDIANRSYNGIYFAKKPMASMGDNVAKIWRSHTFRTGWYSEDYGNIQPPQGKAQGVITETASNPTGTGNPFADLLVGNVQSFNQVNFNPPVKIRSILTEFYLQDSWKVTKRLTVEMGMRFQHDPEGTDVLGIGHAIFSPAAYAASCPGGTLGSCPNVYLPGFTWNKINPAVDLEGYKERALYYAPRFGFAYDVFGSGKTVIRGGIGDYRYRGPSGGGGQPIGINLPTGSVNYSPPTPNGTTLKGLDSLTVPFISGQNAGYPSLADPLSSQLQMVWTDNFGIVQKLPWNSEFEASYVNTMGRHLPEILLNNMNAVPYGAMLSNPTANSQLYRPYQNYQDITIQAFDAYSDYNALQAGFRHRSSKYLISANYTFSKVTGNQAVGTENTTSNSVQYGDALNSGNDHGPLNFDRRNIFNLAYSVNLPSLNNGNRLVKGAINGWTASGIVQITSGANLQNGNNFGLSLPAGYVVNGKTISSVAGITGTPDVALAPVLTCNPTSNLAANQYLNPSCFSLPTPGHNGSFVIPEAFGPGFFNTDLSLFKSFKFSEKRSLQFRAEAFNVLNHANRSFGVFNDLNLTFNSSGTQTNPLFGTANGKIGFRILQFVAKFYF